jgi:hypothetical protein
MIAQGIARGFPTTRSYFLIERNGTTIRNSISSVFKNKGAEEMTLSLLRAQLLVFRRVLMIVVRFLAL